MNERHAVNDATRQFQIDGELLGVRSYGSGHINDTYCAIFRQAGAPVRYIVQRINQNVFRDPAALMENIQRVTSHLAAKLANEPDSSLRALTLIPVRDGRTWYVDEAGGYWRVYRFIERAHTCDAVESTDQAFQAAQAYGRFQEMLLDLPVPRLHESIADFHNTPSRLMALEAAISSDVANRAYLAKAEIEFVLAHQSIANLLPEANLPERIVHNDTKLNNVMLDDTTGEAICVVDLDTVMPGLTIHDFGDMVRTATSPAEEDEQDLSKVTMQFPMFEALVRGYLASAGGFLTKTEKQHLVFAGKLVAFEQGVRFLADYLSGDVYYKIRRDRHNLDRCRTQLKLIESIRQQEERMHLLVHSL